MEKITNFNNMDFSNPAKIPVIMLLMIACQNEESTEQCKKYLEEYKEKLKKGDIENGRYSSNL